MMIFEGFHAVDVIEVSTQGWANRAAVVPQMGWVQLHPS